MGYGLSGLIRDLRPWATQLINYAAANGWNPRITSTRRTHSAQRRLYDRYLAGGNPYPVAPPGTSAHEFGFAFDLVTTPYNALKTLGKVWQGWGGVWGGGFEDIIHFEYPGFPHAAVHRASSAGWLVRHRADLANAALGFIPGPVGIVASFTTPTVADDQPWWEDPQGYAHGLWGVLKRPFLQGP